MQYSTRAYGKGWVMGVQISIGKLVKLDEKVLFFLKTRKYLIHKKRKNIKQLFSTLVL